MRELPAAEIENAIYEIFLEACMSPPQDVEDAVRHAANVESVPHARETLLQLTENNEVARRNKMPACQDTGMAVVFADIGQDVHIVGEDFEAAVNAGVKRAYKDGYFRCSTLEPLTRKPLPDNLPATIHVRIVPGSGVKLTAAPKGFGSENMSRIKMLRPADGVQGVKDFIYDAVEAAGGSPCPPVVLGIGIGGTFETAPLAAKRALLRTLGESAPDPVIADLERELLDGINALGIGPMGLGGDTTCLGVHIETLPTHIAGLPAAVNFCCHMLRHAERCL